MVFMKELAIDWQPHYPFGMVRGRAAAKTMPCKRVGSVRLSALTPNPFWDSAGQGGSKKLCLVKEGFLCLCFDGNAKSWNQSFNHP
jgi:hypothetical protein